MKITLRETNINNKSIGWKIPNNWNRELLRFEMNVRYVGDLGYE
jgi:hypothetical protein